MKRIFVIVLALTSFSYITPRICEVGYGQRGLKFRNSIIWERNCRETDYCFEAVTTDIKKMRTVIDYPWDPYYSQFFVKGCGGAYGMQLKDYHPWSTIPGAREKVLGSLKVNLTFPATITTQGGVELFDLRYTCRQDFCSGAFQSVSRVSFGVALLVSAVLSAVLVYA